MNGESSSNAFRISTGISANRTTEDWKLEFSVSGNYRESFIFPVDGRDTTIQSFNRNYSARSLIAKSLGPHLSLGAITSASTSTFGNTSLSFSINPGIEVNAFPYAESTRRQLTALYSAGCAGFSSATLRSTATSKRRGRCTRSRSATRRAGPGDRST